MPREVGSGKLSERFYLVQFPYNHLGVVTEKRLSQERGLTAWVSVLEKGARL